VPQNVEIIEGFSESWTKKDLAGVMERAHPEIEFDWSASRSPFSDVYRGHQGLMRFWKDQEDAFEEFSVELVEAVECDSERLITVNKVRAKGRGSGATTEARGAMLWTVRDGAIVSAKLFQERAEALQAAGLS
jgi:ketosteroid isomerase-like protein